MLSTRRPSLESETRARDWGEDGEEGTCVRWFWKGVDADCKYAAAVESPRPSTNTWRSEIPWPEAVSIGSPRGAESEWSANTRPLEKGGSASRDAMARGNRGIRSSNITQSNDCVIAYYRRTRDTKGRVTDTYPTAATIQYQARARLIYNGKVTTLQSLAMRRCARSPNQRDNSK